MKLCILQYTQCIDSLCTVWFDHETQNATTVLFSIMFLVIIPRYRDWFWFCH